MATVLVVTFAYVAVRYVVYGPYTWSRAPLFLFNKAAAWSALVLAGATLVRASTLRVVSGRRVRVTQANSPRALGNAAATLAIGHVIMSVALLDPAYYPKLYEDNSTYLHWYVEASLAVGALGIYAVVRQLTRARSDSLSPAEHHGSSVLSGEATTRAATVMGPVPDTTDTRPPGVRPIAWPRVDSGRALLTYGALHTMSLGATGWLSFDSWPGHLPPVTMLACAMAVAAVFVNWRIRVQVRKLCRCSLGKTDVGRPVR